MKSLSVFDVKAGDRFGAWSVLTAPAQPQGKNPLVPCRCSCGTERIMHWQRLRSGSSPACMDCNTKARVRTRFEARYIPEPNSGCWLWTAAENSSGYALLHADGKDKAAHRVAWELYRGPIPTGMHVLHKCDVRCCVNPAHLFLGTNADNVADKVAKHRQMRGERASISKLTEPQAIQIRALRGSGRPQRDVGAEFGVSYHTVSGIWRDKTWRHVA